VKILITGGDGFIGSNLVPRLIAEGHSIVVISNIKNSNSSTDIIHVIGDFDDNNILNNYLPDVDLVIHLAYSTVPENSMKNPVFDIKSNVIPTLNLLKKMAEHNVKKVVFVSSGGAVYGENSQEGITEDSLLNPISSYGISKMMIENSIQLLARNYKVDFCILRIANAYGPGHKNKNNQGVINIWLHNVQNDLPIVIMGNGSVKRDYIHVSDIVEAFITVIRQNISGVFNIGSSVGTSLKDVINLIEKRLNKKANVNYIENRGYDVQCNILSFSKFNSISGWKPRVNIESGISLLIESKR
jgi:UDP-glucose 4-epimerase